MVLGINERFNLLLAAYMRISKNIMLLKYRQYIDYDKLN
ncbi:hypothetical protein CSCA_0395 [Clostridium scatologenes]|uniref:Uncharacterized protein n=1 Tax=Clostridium scatologenes TaxID=1548 RepID=A0A0E3JYH6_CLOSL|nr:hypothetical protein CSCA_0395 [Clostridium scatologenes]